MNIWRPSNRGPLPIPNKEFRTRQNKSTPLKTKQCKYINYTGKCLSLEPTRTEMKTTKTKQQKKEYPIEVEHHEKRKNRGAYF